MSKIVGIAASLLWLGSSTIAASQVVFDRPLQIFIPYPAGGSIDVSIRLIAERIVARGGPHSVIVNRPGAGGIVAAQAVKAARPDGHTLLVGDHALFGILPTLKKDMPIDVANDFTAVALLRTHRQVCAIPKSLPANNVAEFLALARSKPGGLSYASQSPGSSGHILGAMLAKATGAPLVHVPYRGEAPAVTDLVHGHVAMLCSSYDGLAAQLEADTLKPLAVSRRDRDPLLPKTPTFAEAGVAMEEFVSWNGVLVATGTPTAMIDALGTMFTAAVNAPEVASKLKARGIDIADDTPAAFAAFIPTYRAKIEQMLEGTGVSLE